MCLSAQKKAETGHATTELPEIKMVGLLDRELPVIVHIPH